MQMWMLEMHKWIGYHADMYAISYIHVILWRIEYDAATYTYIIIMKGRVPHRYETWMKQAPYRSVAIDINNSLACIYTSFIVVWVHEALNVVLLIDL